DRGSQIFFGWRALDLLADRAFMIDQEQRRIAFDLPGGGNRAALAIGPRPPGDRLVLDQVAKHFLIVRIYANESEWPLAVLSDQFAFLGIHLAAPGTPVGKEIEQDNLALEVVKFERLAVMIDAFDGDRRPPGPRCGEL